MMLTILSSFIPLIMMPYFTFAQYTGCNYAQQMVVGASYNISSPGGNSYSANTNCRWFATAPIGYIILANCYSMMPSSDGCVKDRLEVSPKGRMDVADAGNYCGTGPFQVQSVANQIAIALRVPGTTPGGRFTCILTSQLATTTTHSNKTRIVNGENTTPTEFPMMAALVYYYKEGLELKCGATIISKKYALTAAHCFNNGIQPNRLLVGAHNYSSVNQTEGSEIYEIEKPKLHPGFKRVNGGMENDIACIQTKVEISFDVNRAACLPFKYKNQKFQNREVTALGWGHTSIYGRLSQILQKVDLDVTTIQYCQKIYKNVLTDKHICTYRDKKDTCQFDSGGPVFYNDTSTYTIYLVGIISFGNNCGGSEPGVNTRVTEFLDWIKKHTKVTINSNCAMSNRN